MSTGELAEQAICFAAERIADRVEELISNLDLPSVRYKPRVYREGDKWLAVYGDNSQDGVVGVGESPGEAVFHFDREWDKRTTED